MKNVIQKAFGEFDYVSRMKFVKLFWSDNAFKILLITWLIRVHGLAAWHAFHLSIAYLVILKMSNVKIFIKVKLQW